MAYDTQTGQQNLRATVYDGIVKGFAEPSYKFKQAVSVVPTSAWKNYFFREDPTVLTGQAGNAVKGIPRGADFPTASANWERVLATIEKYGLESTIPWEDVLTNEVDVRDRTLRKIAEAVAKSVDDAIWDVLTESRSVSNIQSITITGGRNWGATSAAIIDNLLEAKQKIAEYNYDTSNLIAFISPKDHRYLMNYLAEKGAQFPSVATDVANNGNSGTLAGIKLVVSNSVTASYALVCVPKVCATWKESVPLQTDVEEDKFKSIRIRAVEMGVTQLTDPKSCVLVIGTQA